MVHDGATHPPISGCWCRMAAKAPRGGPGFPWQDGDGDPIEIQGQSLRTRQSRDLDLTTALHTHDRPGRYTVAIKVIDIFGNDTMTLVPVNVG